MDVVNTSFYTDLFSASVQNIALGGQTLMDNNLHNFDFVFFVYETSHKIGVLLFPIRMHALSRVLLLVSGFNDARITHISEIKYIYQTDIPSSP